MYNPNEQKIDFIKKNDDMLITITFDGLWLSYQIDKQAVSKEVMAAILEEARERTKPSKL